MVTTVSFPFVKKFQVDKKRLLFTIVVSHSPTPQNKIKMLEFFSSTSSMQGNKPLKHVMLDRIHKIQVKVYKVDSKEFQGSYSSEHEKFHLKTFRPIL
jgi:hypothetical protein